MKLPELRLSRKLVPLVIVVGLALALAPAAWPAGENNGPAARARGGAGERLAKAALQGALTFLLETRTTIGGFEFDPKQGMLTLRDVRIANPKGFGEGEVIAAEVVTVEAQPDLLRAEEPLINLIRLQGGTVNLEQNLREGVNVKKLLDSVSRFQKERKQPQFGREAEESKVLRIKKGVFDALTLRVSTETLVRQTRTWRLDPIELDFAEDDATEGISADKALSQALRRLLEEINKTEAETETRDVIPGVGDLLNRLQQ